MEPSEVLAFIAKWAPVLVLVASVVNAFTEHHSKQPSWLKGIFAAIERLSVITSKGTPGVLKAPLTDKVPDDAGR